MVEVHSLNLVSVASLQAKLLRMRWLMTVLEILQEWGKKTIILGSFYTIILRFYVCVCVCVYTCACVCVLE